MPAFLSAAITVPASYAASPDVSLDFEPDTLVFHLLTGSGTLFSFDGVNDHGMVQASEIDMVLPTKRKKVWFKQLSGAATARLQALTQS